MSNFDINFDIRTDRRMENRTPISHPATSRCDKKYQYFWIEKSALTRAMDCKEIGYSNIGYSLESAGQGNSNKHP